MRLYWDHTLGAMAPLQTTDASADTQIELLEKLLDGALNMYWEQVSCGMWTGTGETEIKQLVRELRDGKTKCNTESFSGKICISAPDVWTPMICAIASKTNAAYSVE